MAGVEEDRAVPLGRLLSVAPGLPTTDMARTAEHYRRLGFTFAAPGSASIAGADSGIADGESGIAGADFAIATRDGIALHFALKPDHDPARTATWVYIGVDNADELAAEFVAAGAGQGRVPRNTDYKMRELAHIDPDGNLLLFGSRLTEPQPPATVQEPEPDGSRDQDPSAFDFAAALKRGDVDRLRELLAADPTLATSIVNGNRPLHLFADAPGHRPNAAAVVSLLAAAGADLDAHAIGTWHHETALHWAASNDDVELIDVLLDAGADIEHPGSSIGGGPPAQSALGYAQWAALRRLVERGAQVGLSHAAALGLMPTLKTLTEANPPPGPDDLSLACWNACRAGQLPAAKYLAANGADLSWPAPWSGETPLDAARAKHQREIVGWLIESGGRSGS